eukprot:SAG11_NODE_3464_length_2431_cov_2.371355_2_plen_186_part_00
MLTPPSSLVFSFSSNPLGKWLGSHARDPLLHLEPNTRAALVGDAPPVCAAGTPLPELRLEVRDAFERVRQVLCERLNGTGYHGPLSVDAIFYHREGPGVADQVADPAEVEEAQEGEEEQEEQEDGLLVMKPISEINLRENMGTLALHLAQYVHASKAGFYTILNASVTAVVSLLRPSAPLSDPIR